MKPKQALALAGRLLVGALLIYAGATKAAGPKEEFAFVLASYDFVPRDFVAPLSAFLPWVELLLGWTLVLGVRLPAAAAAAGGLFGAFLLALLSVISRGIELPNCGCFGEAIHLSPKQTFLLDAAAAAWCWLIWKERPKALSLDSWSERGQ